jgi:hypothetical protein
MFNLPKELVQKIIQYTGCFFYSVHNQTLTDFRKVNETIGKYRREKTVYTLPPMYTALSMILPITNKKQYFFEKNVYLTHVVFYVGVLGYETNITSFYSIEL